MHVRWLVPFGAGIASAAQVALATQYLTIEQVRRAAFPEATTFVATTPKFDAASLGANAGWTPRIWQARKDDAILGWIFEDAVTGKSEQITYALAIDPYGAVIALEVLEYREAHGGEVRLAPWRKQFVGKTVHDPIEINRDIKNISGATLSCRHLTEGVKRLLQVYDRALAATVKDGA